MLTSGGEKGIVRALRIRWWRTSVESVSVGKV